MTDTLTVIEAAEPAVLPAAASLDGKTNGYIHACIVVSQRMHYAACLSRIGAINDKSGRLPADWNACASACRDNSCPAKGMREQELLQDKAIYFAQRGAILVATAARSEPVWSAGRGGKKAAPPAAAHPTSKKASMLSDLADAGKASYADAITNDAAVASPLPEPVVSSPAPTSSTKKVAIPGGRTESGSPRAAIKTLPGESPLQAARRIAAERASQGQPASIQT